MNPAEIFAIHEKATALEKELAQTQAEYRNKLNEYIKDYFKGNIPNVLALTKNQFITGIHSKSFELRSGENGIYWVVTGYVTTVKDGIVKHGYSTKTLYQGEYEVMPKELKSHTLDTAKQLSLPVFPIVERYYGGADFANIGYELARNENLGILLVWRKGASAYVDRSSKNISSESELQVLPIQKTSAQTNENLKVFIENTQDEAILNIAKRIQRKFISVAIHTGGRLKKEIILQHANTINELFGHGTVSKIVTNIEKQNMRKTLSNNEKPVSTIKKKDLPQKKVNLETFSIKGYKI